ncbi:MAG: hypothetical protein OEM29_05545 [Thermoplasmata archaeon]|nr:hypothetical protein [Thermoplasmata archaeon]
MQKEATEPNDRLGISNPDLSAIRKQRRMENLAMPLRAVAAAAAGFIPSITLMTLADGSSSSYPYAAASVTSVVAPKDGRSARRLSRIVSWPWLLFGIALGLAIGYGLVHSSFGIAPEYGAYRRT